MLLNAILIAALLWSDGGIDGLSITGYVYGAMLGLLALLLFFRQRGAVAVVGRGVAVAIIFMVVAGFVANEVLSRAVTGYAGMSTSGRHLVLILVLIGLQLGLLRSLPLSAVSINRSAILTGAAALPVVVLFFVIYYAASIAGTFVRLGLLGPNMRGNDELTAAVARAQSCAVSFAERGRGYPTALSDLGPSEGDAGCLEQALASGRASDGQITVEYLPRRPDAEGRITRFQVTAAGSVDYDGKPQAAVGDETGVIRAGDAQVDVQLLPVVRGGLHVMRAVRACAELYRAANPAGRYPPDFRALTSIPGANNERAARWLGCFWSGPALLTSLDPDNPQSTLGAYTVSGDSTDYVLHIRPRTYGVDGVRSLFATSRGPVHWTTENREARNTDPIVPSCAYAMGDGTCAPSSGSELPAKIELALPDSVRADERFTIRILDRRPPGARTYPYQHHVVCNVRRGDMDPTPPADYSDADTASCLATPDPERSEFRTVTVRVWTRDHGTAESYLERRIRLMRADSIELAYRRRAR